MAIATLASVVAAYPVFLWTNHTFRSLARERQDLQAEASARMDEYVQGLPVIRAFRLTGERLERFRRALDDYRRVNLRLVLKIAPVGLAFMATVMLGIPCVLFFGALWLFDGTIDAGTLVVFAVLVLRVYQPVFVAAESFETLRIADASLDRIARVLDEPAQPTPTTPAALPERLDITLDQVTFGYKPGQPVLHDLDLHVPAGTTTAIVGPSGAGKTTVLHLVARFWDTTGGTVRIGGVDVRDLTAEQLFDAVTVVFQDVYLFPGTIFDNIAFGNPDAAPDTVHAAARAARAHDFITALPDGYTTPVGEGGATLSGGERQRISIARAILKDAPIVLLDEATSAIDPTNERLVQAALAELVVGKTLMVVAHRLATIRSADQIVTLDHGRLAERGTHDQLLAAGGLYAHLWAQRQRATTWRVRGGTHTERCP
jgi:ATP-binding cassette subfamily B protein IrtB